MNQFLQFIQNKEFILTVGSAFVSLLTIIFAGILMLKIFKLEDKVEKLTKAHLQMHMHLQKQAAHIANPKPIAQKPQLNVNNILTLQAAKHAAMQKMQQDMAQKQQVSAFAPKINRGM